MAKTGAMQSWGSVVLLFSGYRIRCTTVLKRRKLGIYCSQEKETGAFILVHYCSQEKEIGSLLFWGRRELPNGALQVHVHYCFSSSTVLRRRKLVHYSSQWEGNWSFTTHVFRRRGWCSTFLGRRAMGLYFNFISICTSTLSKLCPNYFYDFLAFLGQICPKYARLYLNYAQRDYALNFAFCPNFAPSLPQLFFGRIPSCLIYYYSIQKS